MSLLPQNDIYDRFAYFGGYKSRPPVVGKNGAKATLSKTAPDPYAADRARMAESVRLGGGSINEGQMAPIGRQPAPESRAEIGGVGPSDGENRRNGLGVSQTGRNLSKINLSPSAGVADFTGPSFPTQAPTNQLSTPYPHTYEKGMERVHIEGDTYAHANPNGRIVGLEGDPAGLSYSSNQTPASRAASFQRIGAEAGIGTSAFGAVGGESAASGAVAIGKGSTQRPSLQELAGDPAQLRFDASNYTPSEGFSPSAGATSREEMARRSAFLDATDSLSGMRAVKAGLGIESRGQDHYANVGGELKAISQDDKNDLLNTPMSGVSAWKQDWMSKNLKAKSGESEVPQPSEVQNPPVAPSPVVTAEPIGAAQTFDWTQNNNKRTLQPNMAQQIGLRAGGL